MFCSFLFCLLTIVISLLIHTKLICCRANKEIYSTIKDDNNSSAETCGNEKEDKTTYAEIPENN